MIQLRAGLERAARGETTLADMLTTSEGIDLPPAMKEALNSNDLIALQAVQGSGQELRNIPEGVLRSNTIPILAVVGELDWARPDAEAMVAVVPRSHFELIPGASHITTVSHPLFLDAIVRFLVMR